ncbi:DUF4382 domain-containing protein [Anditalea andensis]|uniref:DUF4382 domain-containing protein n=1 Tax=Anditalea andensis TaxID=1048983 RepID=A0A074KTI2_9BACT|nr:DUF4382 domain-containing protein [Anditalea andensis]KEO73271.1 hypothetical protein EL17_13050 [Anditalea andensis]
MVLLASCSGDDERENGLVNIFLIDAPGDFDEVFVEVLGVEVVPDNGEPIFYDFIPANKMVNVANLVGEASLLVGRGRIPIGMMTQMTLVLGEELYLQRAGQRINMEYASPENRRIVFETNYNILGGVSYDLYIDIDLARSVRGIAGVFVFDPVARNFSNMGKGILTGTVNPPAARPYIYAFSDTDTLTTLTNAEGRYFFRGLNSGNYQISIQPRPPYTDTTFISPIRTDTLNRIPTIVLRRPAA